jgi:DNA adenine methylase Dam
MFDAQGGSTPQRIPTAEGRFTAIPRPFLKWAGSKQALIQQILPVLPKKFGRYYEPFLGSGALFFYLKPKKASLSDVSEELINVWVQVRDAHQHLIDQLAPLRPNKDLYYKIRESRSGDPKENAAEFIYLNRSCWNGLYRVNSQGKFNVPYGSPRSDFIFDKNNIKSCSALLRGSKISIGIQYRKSVIWCFVTKNEKNAKSAIAGREIAVGQSTIMFQNFPVCVAESVIL